MAGGTLIGAKAVPTPPVRLNWLAELDRRVQELSPQTNWFEDQKLAVQRCRRFLMARYLHLMPRVFPDEVLRRELSRGERKIRGSDGAGRIQQGLSADQNRQLAALFLDILEALNVYTAHTKLAVRAHALAGEGERRTRMLSRKTSKIRSDLKRLLKYANHLDPVLALEYIRAATRCLEILENLEPGHSDSEFFRSLKEAEYQRLTDPVQLGLVELFSFFHHECELRVVESEVRTAMIHNALLTVKGRTHLHYKPTYKDAESKGCPAVRRAVSRWTPEPGTNP